MTDDRSLERAARIWIEDGPTVAPVRAVEAALDRIESTSQERAWEGAWRMPIMNAATKIAGLAAVVVVAGAGALLLFGGGRGGFGSPPTPEPSVSASVAPSDAPSPATSAAPASNSSTPSASASFDPWDPAAYTEWSTHTSEIYGLQIGHPGGWTVTPAVREWQMESDAADFLTEAADAFVAPDEEIRVSVWAVTVEAGTTLREWVADYCAVATQPCENLDERLDPALREVRDQHRAGVVIEFVNDVQAFMPSWAYDLDQEAIWTLPAPGDGGEIIIVAGWRPGALHGSRDLVDAFSLQLCTDCGAP